MTYHIFCFDGTQNGLDDQHPTNVRIISQLADVPGQKVHYFEGPGNDDESLIEHLLGSAVGAGMYKTCNEALEVAKNECGANDKIAVFGFSRGAAIARMFCSGLAKDSTSTEFLGCFDTVFARLPFGKRQQEPLFGDLHVSGLVKTACHAVSLDEDRKSFAPNLMNKRPGVHEVWFKGNHSDIGGGYEERGLADASLGWMLTKCTCDVVCGLRFKYKQLEPLIKNSIRNEIPNSGEIYEPAHEPHREDLPLRRETRTPIVMVDGNESGLRPAIYGE